MRNALLTDTAREIKHSLSRFLSIFTIIALGCGFFSGLKATMPDMVDTAEEYFIDSKLMDYKLMSNIGIKSEDVQVVRNAEGVDGAIPGYSKDVFYYYNNQNCVLKVMSYNYAMSKQDSNALNEPTVLEGRLPEKSGECVVEVKLSSPDTFKIGNKLTLASPYEDEDILDTLATDTYEIVGIITSPLYIGYERDSTTVGNGTVLSYIMIPEEDFVADYYTELYISFDGLDDYDPFSDEYKNAVEEKKEAAVKAFEDSVKSRYDTLVSDAEEDIADAKEDVQNLEQVLGSDLTTLQYMAQQGQAEYDDSKAQYDALEDKTTANVYLLQSKLLNSQKQLDMLNEIITARSSGDTSADEKYQAQLDEANEQITAAEEELADMADLKFYEYDRFSASTDYSSYQSDSMKVDSIAKVFPMFFILIAALVCLTTMTRMVEEQRIQIGTYKALGYSSGKIISKYIIYATLAAVFGSAVGTAIGLQVFPRIIYSCYKIMYNIPTINTPFRVDYMLWCMLAAVLCTNFAVVYSCIRELRAEPATLMRPKPPASGRRVVLERVGFIWKRLDFLAKVTVRNLLRYKKRFFMTIVGVAGCTALIIAGFGLKYSIKSIADKQFNEVFRYDAVIVMNSDNLNNSLSPAENLEAYDEIESCLPYMSVEGTVDGSDSTQSASMIIPERTNEFGTYVSLTDIESGETCTLDDDEVIITDKLSRLMDLKAGDSITVSSDEKGTATFKIKAVVVNYAMHYIYMSPKLYEQAFDEEPTYNMAFTCINDNADEEQFKENLIADDDFLGMSYKSDSSKGFLNSVDSLDAIVILLIVCAGFLAVVVLYNLANINITERVREIATIKVLGFYDGETSAYIYRENLISAVIGILIGLVLGKVLHYFVVVTSEVDIVLFNRQLIWWAYLFGALLTVVFAFLVNLQLHFKLKKIDMVESLKSIE